MPNKKSARNNGNKPKTPKPILFTPEEKKFATLAEKRCKGLVRSQAQRSKELFIKSYEESYSTTIPEEKTKNFEFDPQPHFKRSKIKKSNKEGYGIW